MSLRSLSSLACDGSLCTAAASSSLAFRGAGDCGGGAVSVAPLTMDSVLNSRADDLLKVGAASLDDEVVVVVVANEIKECPVFVPLLSKVTPIVLGV